MATTKITDLTAYTDPVNTDVLPIVDVTSDVTKKVSVANVMKNASLGTAAAPGISFDGDPNTGIYSPGANQVAITTDGTQRLLIDSAGAVTIAGDLTVNGTTTNINTSNLIVEDKNIVLGDVAVPTDVTADGGGITLLGTTNKTINWVDSTDAWTSSERFSYPLGSAAAPTLTFTGDANTGIYSPGADQVAISTGGSGRLFVNSSGQIGVGVSPTDLLHIQATNDARLRIKASGSGAGTNSTINLETASEGHWVIQSGNATSSGLRFFDVNASSERMRLDSSGRLGVGTSSPGSRLTVNRVNFADASATGATTLSNAGITVEAATDTNNRLMFGIGSTGGAPWIQAQNTSSNATPSLILNPVGGSVGIGVTSVTDQLEVASGNFRGATIRCGTTAHRPTLSFFNTADSLAAYIQASGNSLIFGSMATDYGGHSPRMTLTGTGLGIGTTSPSNPLAVVSSGTSGAVISAFDATASRAYFQAGGTSGNQYLQMGADTTGSFINDFQSSSTGLKFQINSTERARIDASGRLLVGTSTARANFTGGTRTTSFQVEGTTLNDSALSILRNSNDTGQSAIYLAKSRSTAVGDATPDIVADGDSLGSIFFQGADNTNFVNGASISAQVDGTPGANDMPGRLVFSTTADGAASPTERMRITNAGSILSFAASANDAITAGVASGAGATPYLFAGVHSRTGTATGGTLSYSVAANGNVQNTNGSYTTISDAKLKENIVNAGSQWDDLKAIQIRNWNFKVETGHETHRQIGPIAQELEAVCPGLVFETSDRDEDGNQTGEVTKGVNQSVLYMKAVKALQEAMERIESLEAAVTALQQS